MLIAALVVRGLKAARVAPDPFGCYLATGLTLLLGLEALVNDFPREPKYRAELAVLYQTLGIFRNLLYEGNEAEKPFRQCVALREQLVADFWSDVEEMLK